MLPIGERPTGASWTYFGADWCAMFVTYCFDSCGLIPSILDHPIKACETSAWYNAGKVKLKSEYTPKAGDIIFYGVLGNCYHTGIVTDCDGTYVYTVEGNSGGNPWSSSKVLTHKYPLNAASICGYYTASEF